MRTTLLNPTVWLLAATTVTAAAGVLRREAARQSIERVVRMACSWPVLTALLLMAGAGLGSRAVLGYRSPGVTAEQVNAVQRFLEQRRSHAPDARAEFAEWMAEAAASAPPWTPLPGVTECPAEAMGHRVRLFTNHAHSPMLLLAEVPVVRFGGARALNAVLMLLSISTVFIMAVLLLEAARLDWRSRRGLLLIAAVAGWQPVLAGVRQADAALPAAGLVAIAWHLAARKRRAAPAVAASLAACLVPPAWGVWAALLRSAPRAAAIAGGFVSAAVLATVAVAGFAVVPGFVMTAAYAARAYAAAVTNYSVLGRFVAADTPGSALIIALAVAATCSWWRGRTRDSGFAAFLTLSVLTAPVLWSQHLALLLVPAAVLFRHVSAAPSSAPLAGYAALLLLLSLPDPAAAGLNKVLSVRVSPGAVIPIGAAALVVLWSWVVFGVASPQTRPDPARVSLV